MTQFGYARVSTKGQSLADQINQLKSAGVDKILAEKFTGTTTSRPQFDKLIKLVKPGDTITVTKLDRLARNTREALNVLDPLMNKGVKFNVLNIGLLENSTIGRLVKTILLAVAEMERDMIVDRTQEGKRYARLHKKNYHEGRPKRLITPHYKAAYSYLLDHTYKDTSKAFNISVSTLQRIKKQINNEQSH
ncbi:recombinase family protein [Limosilactobacillus reuteri]|uniref:Recombinase family protein n=1 Tax=Limosilactobacillus reuteri TaxID=1598 RepID=A0A1C1ZTP3_LIMRT|nr:recombinase family protein [Limosilactobacillus reuteri]MCH5379661.1 recombinase family protein [Limosilactobacillus reuteri]MCT3208773.1 recombinase family protein [Limosilactobacillus reuteri]MCT3217298.1 recombinase family protein [Limosilactobacillus reuteri]MRH09754.1 recombinase family protein [Limosilactobacillus reuteri]OCW61799.1 DNA invertase Pin [Limosilactobacillus reuteri]